MKAALPLARARKADAARVHAHKAKAKAMATATSKGKAKGKAQAAVEAAPRRLKRTPLILTRVGGLVSAGAESVA